MVNSDRGLTGSSHNDATTTAAVITPQCVLYCRVVLCRVVLCAVLCQMYILAQRIHFDYKDISVGPGNLPVLERAVAELAQRYSMEWQVCAGSVSWCVGTTGQVGYAHVLGVFPDPAVAVTHSLTLLCSCVAATPPPPHTQTNLSTTQVSYRPRRKRMAVLVSKMDHCLFDLLIRQRNGELPCDIPVVISNHPDLGGVAGMFGVDYEHLGFKKDLDKAVAKQQQEAAIEKVCVCVECQGLMCGGGMGGC